MDFNSKNFQYVNDSFGNIMDRIQKGGRLYLRALSDASPSERPANLETDFPSLADDFRIPSETAFVRDKLFSSILRISGPVNMWLHYDVRTLSQNQRYINGCLTGNIGYGEHICPNSRIKAYDIVSAEGCLCALICSRCFEFQH